MSHIVQFSYIFNEDINRIYDCFCDFNLVTEVTFYNVMTNAKKLKGNFLNEEGAIFQFTFKNYYNF